MCPRCAPLGLFITTAAAEGARRHHEAVLLARAGSKTEREAEYQRIKRAAKAATQGYLVTTQGHSRGITDHEILTGGRPSSTGTRARKPATTSSTTRGRPPPTSGVGTRGSPAATPNASARPQAPVVPDGQGREGPDRPHRRSPQTDRGGQRPATDGTALSANGRVADTLWSSAGRCSVLTCHPQVIDGRRISRARSADPARQRQRIACVTRAEPPNYGRVLNPVLDPVRTSDSGRRAGGGSPAWDVHRGRSAA